jgi:hypothetical protein
VTSGELAQGEDTSKFLSSFQSQTVHHGCGKWNRGERFAANPANLAFLIRVFTLVEGFVAYLADLAWASTAGMSFRT